MISLAEQVQRISEEEALAESKKVLLSKLQSELEPEESILWSELIRPDVRRLKLVRGIALGAMGLLFILTSTLSLTGPEPTALNVLIEIVFAFFAIRFATKFLDQSGFSLRPRIAILTNMRAIECDSNGAQTIAWYTDPNFGNVQANQTRIDLGDLFFAKDDEGRMFGFKDVPNAAVGAEILFRAQAKVRANK
ncbi:MAG: hypothetical protein DKT66_22835 [Candidatus Melainabacteria bacterium]|nr:MAG: hypothetical protein DKT66_22835 [Candidatus Melainabacteria bacterium]